MEKDVTVTEEVTETVAEESSIDLDKLDAINKPKKEVSELDQLRADLKAQTERADELERKRLKDKEARDKAMKDRAALSREVKEKEKALEEPNEELALLRSVLAEKELAEKKTSLLLAATDRMAINQTMAGNIVNSVYHPDTGEVDVDGLVDSFTAVINDVRKSEFERGYNLRDTEQASQKPRSIGGEQQELSPEDEALARYRKRNSKRR